METEISRTKRYLGPVDYTLKVEKYSRMSRVNRIESGVFEAGGYRWRLLFYPTGDSANNGANHISLYLEIVVGPCSSLWEVNVHFKLFVYNQIDDNYLVVQDLANGGVKRFNKAKKIWGSAQVLPLETFRDVSKGYIFSDSCVFGADISIIDRTGKGELFSIADSLYIFTWEIERFYTLNQESYSSKVFKIEGRNWILTIYPKGYNKEKGKSVSLFLFASDWKNQIPFEAGLYAEYKLRLIDQVEKKHHEREVSHYFTTCDVTGYGEHSMISLEDLREHSHRFIKEDKPIVVVEFLAFSEVVPWQK